MTKTPWKLLLALGLTHFVADAISGFTVTSTAFEHSLLNISLIIFSYNVIAFGLQPFAGLLVDRWHTQRFAMLGGVGGMAIGLVLFPWIPVISLVVIAIGSAFMHVGAGALASLATPKKSLGAALFTAPGVIGLTLGMLAAFQSLPLVPILLVGAIVTLGILASTILRIPPNDQRDTFTTPVTMSIVIFLLALVLFVALRSTLWISVSATTIPILTLVFGLAAGTGKLAGGCIADRFGRANTVIIATAFSLLCFLEGSVLMIVIGIGALQSSTGIILSAAVQRLPKYSATTTGLILGLGLILAGIVMEIFG